MIPDAAPQWLKDAETQDAMVDIESDGTVIWHGGVWRGGTWLGGIWKGGIWQEGIWRGGTWRGGEWRGGNWLDGTWRGGQWHRGLWQGGIWQDGIWRAGTWCTGHWRAGTWCDGFWWTGIWHAGTWRGGVWQGGLWETGVWHGGLWLAGLWKGGDWLDRRCLRIEYMLALLGMMPDDRGTYIGYRSTQPDGHGWHVESFVQPVGEYRESDLPPAGSGTCVRGIHVSSAAIAWSYFALEPGAQLWRVEFRRADVLDCDGEKVRISGGRFTPIPWPFVPKNAGENEPKPETENDHRTSATAGL